MPLNEHGQIFFHDLCQDLLSGAVQLQVIPLDVALAVWPEGEDDPIVKQLIQRRDLSSELCRL